MTTDFAAFLHDKRHQGAAHGFEPIWMPDFLFDFQREMVTWALRQGRAALFEDCGLGKTPQLLVWAANVFGKTGKPVLILSPLAVAAQTVAEGEKFGIGVERSRDGAARGDITITNYERLHLFDHQDFSGIVCDESSILKSFAGARRQEITGFARKIPYRLLCTATAAPNDYHELGTSSEALGYLGYTDMLHRFFINERNNNDGRRMYGEAPAFRFKGHARDAFWRWVCSWARAARRPSDLGFDDGGFVLPPLDEVTHEVEVTTPNTERLFDLPAADLFEQRAERRRSLEDRCRYAANLVDHGEPALVWCHLNDEGDLLERLIPDAVQVSGKDSEEVKESKLLGFADGKYRVLVTKPKIGAWGLNFQHCAHVVCFPTHSYEQYYQAVRRCWRFGQKRPVVVDIVLTEGDKRVMANLQRKAKAADEMFDALVREMGDALTITASDYESRPRGVPAWL